MFMTYVIDPVSATVIPPGGVNGSPAVIGDSAVQAPDQSPVGSAMVPNDPTVVLPDETAPQLQITGDTNLQNQLQHMLTGNQTLGQSGWLNLLSSLSLPFSNGLNITGQLQKNLFINATMNTTAQTSPTTSTTPTSNTLTLRYDGKKTKAQFGDINAALNGNELVSLNRSVQGLQVDTSLPKGSFTGVVSKLQSQIQTDALYGQNTSGPYYLHMSPLVPGSDTVTLNGSKLTRDQDYTIDYTSGVLSFTRGQLISSADEIRVSYEVMVNGTGGGKLIALRGSYPIDKHLTVGLSHVGFSGNKTNDSQPTKLDRRDQFLGNNLPGPFYLMYRPVVPNSETVTINGIKQQNNVTYHLDYDTGQLTFQSGRQPSLGSTVIVDYQTATGSQTSNDRSVTGLDVNWNSGKGLGLNLQTAVSGGSTPSVTVSSMHDVTDEQLPLQQGIPLNAQVVRVASAPVVGGSETVRAVSLTLIRNQDYTINYTTGEIRLLKQSYPSVTVIPALSVSYTVAPVTTAKSGNSAMVATATYNSKKVTALARYRKTDPGFTSVDQTTISNAERSVEWSTNYSPSSVITLRTSGTNSQVPSSTTTDGSDTDPIQQQNRSYAIDYHHPSGVTVTVQRNSRNSQQQGNTGNNNSSVSDSLTSSWNGNKLSASVNVDRTTSTSWLPVISGLPFGSQPVTSITATQNTVNSAMLNMGYHPTDKVDVEVNLGANSVNALTGGVSSQTGGKSIQAMATYRPKDSLTLTANIQKNSTTAQKTSNGSGMPAQTNSNIATAAQWQATKKVNITTNYTSDGYSDGNFGSSATKTLSSNIAWQPGTRVTVNSYAARQQMVTPDLTAPSQSTLVGIGTQIGPIKNTTLNIDLQHIKGATPEGVNQLWQTEGQSHRSPTLMASSIGLTDVMGTTLNGISGSANYQLNDTNTLSLTSEFLGGSGPLGRARRNAFGINWQYHPNENLTFSIFANRIRYFDNSSPEMNSKANELSAEFSWSF